MAGIYIHIPFCKQACHYCNFHFSTTLHQKDELVNALIKEIALQKNYLSTSIETIYFGGGTPSLLSSEQINSLLKEVYQNYPINDKLEITLECNPDDINSINLESWKREGINRLSIGIQSFFEEDLQWMNRAHNAKQSLQSIQLAKEIEFNNLTIDLIYGVPGLSNEKWLQNLNIANDLGISHLSCYALTVEPKTALEKFIEKGTKNEPDTNHQSEQFEMLMIWAAAHEFEHYEISNFARPGFESKHNSNYWKGEQYLGIGPSAHSFNGTSRQWNISNNAVYIKSIAENSLPFEMEILTEKQRLNEYIMTALRTKEGISLLELSTKFPKEASEEIAQNSSKYIHQELMKLEANHLTLTNKGKLFADGIASDLFAV